MSGLKTGLTLALIASLAGAQPGLAQTKPAATATAAAAKPAAKKPVAHKPVPKGAYRKVVTPVTPPVAVAAAPEPPPPPPAPEVAEAAPAAPEPAAKSSMFGSMKRRFNSATGRDAAAPADTTPLTPEAKAARAQTAAGDWSPNVDMKGVSQVKYRKDVADCEQYADGRDETHAGNAATHSALKVGGITAAVMGVAVVATGGLAAVPFMATGIGMGAGAGAGIGALTGGVGAQKKFRTVVDSCMAGRGYTMLDK